jgi:hypothetical protein
MRCVSRWCQSMHELYEAVRKSLQPAGSTAPADGAVVDSANRCVLLSDKQDNKLSGTPPGSCFDCSPGRDGTWLACLSVREPSLGVNCRSGKTDKGLRVRYPSLRQSQGRRAGVADSGLSLPQAGDRKRKPLLQKVRAAVGPVRARERLVWLAPGGASQELRGHAQAAA